MAGELGAARSAHVDNEKQWVDRIRAGDESAFTAMFRAYAAPLRLFAISFVHSADDAADVVQEVFVKLWRQHESWVFRGSVRAYLYAAVRNQALNRVRQGRVRSRIAQMVARDLPWWGESESDANSDRVAACERAFSRLSEKHRQVLLLRWQHDLTYAEIARVLDIPIRTVDSRLSRALQLMRRFCLS